MHHEQSVAPSVPAVFASVLAVSLLFLSAPGAAKPQKSEVAVPEVERPSAAAAQAQQPAAPDFALKDLDGKQHRLSDYVAEGKTVVLEWFNPDCPFVRKHHEKNKTMAHTSAAYRDKNVVWLAVNSGAPGKQGAGLDRNRKAREDYGIGYPILLDEAGMVGRAYGAKTTPTMVVIAKGQVAYNGAIDDNATPGTLGKTNYVVEALDAVLAGKPVATPRTKSYGCSVKYGPAVP